MDSQAPPLVASQLRWDLTAEQIEAMAAELTESTKLVYDRVGAQERGEVSYENTLKALADVEVEYTGGDGGLCQPGAVPGDVGEFFPGEVSSSHPWKCPKAAWISLGLLEDVPAHSRAEL